MYSTRTFIIFTGSVCLLLLQQTLALSSCQGRCEEAQRPKSAECFCYSRCVEFNNCCEDYKTLCKTSDEKYYCKGECEVVREKCNCTSTCIETKTCCSDYQQSCLGEKAWKDEKCSTQQEMTCPTGFEDPPVILFSLDGFRADYLYRDLTPNIWKIASCGIHAPYMRSVYPTKTFPNHYTIATGLYPESHGIIDNSMYDHEFGAAFKVGRTEAFKPRWWGGEPIWVTVSNQGKKSAAFFWPGSDVNITRYPDYYYKYDGSIPNQDRMYQALRWLDLPAEKRPSIMTLYLANVDSDGHAFGPTDQLDIDLAVADDTIGILMNGLKERRLDNCVNIIVLADHGMAPISCEREIIIGDYGVDLATIDFHGGPFGRIGKSRSSAFWSKFNAQETHDLLRCKHDRTHWQSFLKYQYLPKRFHYANNDRIEPVHLVMDDEWIVQGKKTDYISPQFCNRGSHGFDSEYKSMHALFTAHGPGFKRSYNTTKPFENIEVYNLLTDLMQLTPAPNNGTRGALYHAMSKPPSLPPLQSQEVQNQCVFLQSGPTTSLGCSPCQGLSFSVANQRLNLDKTAASEAETLHMAFGRPQVSAAGVAELQDNIKYCLLTQVDYVTAYDLIKKMPVYVTYTLSSKDRSLSSLGPCSRLDVRVPSKGSTPCSDYAQSQTITAAYLYPPELSDGDERYDAALISNQVPMYLPAVTVWNYMTRVLADWAKSYGGVNVVSGPVFDYDFDGHADTMAILQAKGSFLDRAKTIPIPTHYFMVITRCSKANVDFNKCKNDPNDLEALSFIIPNYAVEPCHTKSQAESDWIPGTLIEHVARIRDVELLTGISFLSTWFHTNAASQVQRLSALRVKLQLPQFTSLWLQDFRSSGGKSSILLSSNIMTLIFPLLLLFKLLVYYDTYPENNFKQY
ncbi:unnamed protein product [Clavelina lepadiformis]|uniref:SMB domain-containing protein n=1 Tax=Clavelina lepadiformis TaxID=159417 RepID=A0ABP0H1Z4_CLALP